MLLVPSHIERDLVNLECDDYDRAIEFCVDKLARMPGVVFVGQFGSIRIPGVSDIDLLIVVADSQFRAVYEKCKRICAQAPNGSYLFAHLPTIIPLSLCGVCRVLHSFNGLRILAGDRDMLNVIQDAPFEVRVVNGVIWNSHLWCSALQMRYRRASLRNMLLMYRNFVQSVAFDYEVLQDCEGRDSIVSWGDTSRSEIVRLSGEEQRELLVESMTEVFCRWIEADWQVQEWWIGTGKSKKGAEDRVEISVNPNVIVRGCQRRDIREARKGLVPGGISEICMKDDGKVMMTLPSYYVEIVEAVKEAFEVWLDFAVFGTGGEKMIGCRSDYAVWAKAAQFYRAAVMSVRECAKGCGIDELEMYQQISCLPFGSCLMRPQGR